MLTGEEVMESRTFQRQNNSIRSIARALPVGRITVRKYLHSPTLEPDEGPRTARPSKLEPLELLGDETLSMTH